MENENKRYCLKCGKKVLESWKFCTYCGSDLTKLIQENEVVEKKNNPIFYALLFLCCFLFIIIFRNFVLFFVSATIVLVTGKIKCPKSSLINVLFVFLITLFVLFILFLIFIILICGALSISCIGAASSCPG